MGYIILAGVVVMPSLLLYGWVARNKRNENLYAENEVPLGIGA